MPFLAMLSSLALKDFLYMIWWIFILYFVIWIFWINIWLTLKFITFELAWLKNMLLTDFYYSNLMLMLLITLMLIVNLIKFLNIFK